MSQMAATATTIADETTTSDNRHTHATAQVTFRVKCDTIGHGEDVYLVDSEGIKAS